MGPRPESRCRERTKVLKTQLFGFVTRSQTKFSPNRHPHALRAACSAEYRIAKAQRPERTRQSQPGSKSALRCHDAVQDGRTLAAPRNATARETKLAEIAGCSWCAVTALYGIAAKMMSRFDGLQNCDRVFNAADLRSSGGRAQRAGQQPNASDPSSRALR